NGYVQSETDPEWNEYFVKSGKVTANLHLERNFSLFRHLVASFPVTRIFVDNAIKKRLCQYASASGLTDALSRQTLRRLRVANLHQTHFHVRLACPVGDADCTPQAEPPQGTGCS